MKTTIALLLTLFSLSTFANSYPLHPDPRLTPGSLCDEPDRFRYPENIAYCEREVSPFLKAEIFKAYRSQLGYSIPGHRKNYKIDHFIPLCAGGSNHQNNLWPQHKSIYTITDPIEFLGCQKLAKGLIDQQDLINQIYHVKMNTALAPQILNYINSK